MIANSLIKILSIVKYEYFMRMIEIKDKKKLLAFIK